MPCQPLYQFINAQWMQVILGLHKKGRQSAVHSPQSAVHSPQSTVGSRQSTVHSRQTMDYGLWTAGYGLWTVDYGLWTMDCGLTIQAFSKVNPKVEPSPMVLLTLMVCWWASIMCLTMERPSPEPPCSRERLLSTR